MRFLEVKKVEVYGLARKVHCFARLLHITPSETRTIHSILNSLGSIQAEMPNYGDYALHSQIQLVSCAKYLFQPLGGESALEE